MKKYVAVGFPLVVAAMSAHAQSSVTLYGLIEEGFGYTNNAGGKSASQLQGGWTAGDRWGLKGAEDLGGGLSAIFTLENGFDVNSGALGNAGRLFGRQAFVGLKSATLGTISLGRQYDSMVDYIEPLTANGTYGGWPFAHPYDNDNTDNSFRINNSIKYTSVDYSGFRFGGLYGLSNQAGGFADNRAFSLGASYSHGPLSAAVGYLQINNAGLTSGGALASNDATFVSQRQQTWGAGVNYDWASTTFGFIYTHSAFKQPTSSVYTGSLGSVNSLKFDNFEVNARYHITPAITAIAIYTFTEGHFQSASTDAKPKWHQVGLMATYNFSPRTDVYVQGSYQHVTGGSTGTVLDQAFIPGAAGAASGRSQLLARVGIMHLF